MLMYENLKSEIRKELGITDENDKIAINQDGCNFIIYLSLSKYHFLYDLMIYITILQVLLFEYEDN